MYQIGIISSQKELHQKFQTLGRHHQCQFKPMKETEVFQQASSLDGILFHDEDERKLGEICRWMIATKVEEKPYIWVLMNEVNSCSGKVYLQLGADGIFCCPRSSEEVALHIRNAFKRQEEVSNSFFHRERKKTQKPACPYELNANNVSLIYKAGTSQHKELILTKMEYGLLEVLLSVQGQVFTYDEIVQQLWTNNLEDKHSRVVNLVFQIRTKFIEYDLNHKDLQTVRNRGYRLYWQGGDEGAN